MSDTLSSEESKHVRFSNIGALLAMALSLLIAISITIVEQALVVHVIVPIVLALLLLLGLGLNHIHQYTLARIYGILLLYTVIMLNFIFFIGDDYFGQLYILLVTLAIFPIVPRSQSWLLHVSVLLGAMCFTVAMLGYNPMVRHYLQELHGSKSFYIRQSPIPAFILFGIMVLFAYVFRHLWLTTEAALALEHQRAEQLLLNILPMPIAKRLKANEHTIADAFEETTVLFADIVRFTTLSTHPAPGIGEFVEYDIFCV